MRKSLTLCLMIQVCNAGPDEGYISLPQNYVGADHVKNGYVVPDVQVRAETSLVGGVITRDGKLLCDFDATERLTGLPYKELRRRSEEQGLPFMVALSGSPRGLRKVNYFLDDAYRFFLLLMRGDKKKVPGTDYKLLRRSDDTVCKVFMLHPQKNAFQKLGAMSVVKDQLYVSIGLLGNLLKCYANCTRQHCSELEFTEQYPELGFHPLALWHSAARYTYGACMELARRYEDGDTTDQDLFTALRLYKHAATLTKDAQEKADAEQKACKCFDARMKETVQHG